jgi:NADPH:quinone reductase-like Zn-dependent oxidoreductase
MESRYPAKAWPSGQGSDLAGIVVEVGENVTDLHKGDEVLGYSWRRSSHATHVLVPAGQLVLKPSALSWPVAGALYAVGCTAVAAIRAIDAKQGETIVVSGAAGGVGCVVVQMLRARGCKVVGIASDGSRDFLASLGAEQVAYGQPDLADRVKKAAGGKIDGFLDLYGPEYVELAIKCVCRGLFPSQRMPDSPHSTLKVPPNRVNTIIAFQKAAELGAHAKGSDTASTPEVMTEVASLVAGGQLDIPIVRTYPLDQVRDAYRELAKRKTHGKIVLLP